MNYTELQDAKKRFPVEEILKERKPLYAARNRFVKAFSRERIANLTIDEFIEGKRDTDTFCYGIERTLDGLGRIRGARADKFGVYYSQEKGKYIFAKKFGTNYRTAFNAIKKAILDLLDAGQSGDLKAIEDSKISPMLKGKILATYFPDRYLNVFDNEHLTHYLRVLNLDTESLVKKDPVYKRETLRKYKDKDPDMRHWDLDVFGKFLYQNFPPKKGGPDEKADDYFPTTDKYSYVDYSINYEDTSTKDMWKGIAPKVDYEKEARKYRRYGDRGEKIVIKAEIDRLMAELGLTQKQAEKAVIPMSQDSDSHGYDIKSLNPDGSFRYIEVKATTGKAGDVEFYYTENEYEKSKEYGKDYYIYIVYEIRSDDPKIWRIQNPFLFGSLTMRPVQYKVTVHAIK